MSASPGRLATACYCVIGMLRAGDTDWTGQARGEGALAVQARVKVEFCRKMEDHPTDPWG